MLADMRSLFTDPVASAVVIIDESDGATLTEIPRLCGKPVSTVQRAVEGLCQAGVLAREAPRGRFCFRADAPRHALRELADWNLGNDAAARLAKSAREHRNEIPDVPSTIRADAIRRAWPRAIRSIVTAYHPARVVLFGSQAKGDAGPDSDVDLLVIFDKDIDRRERRVGIRRLLGDMPFAKDVLVATTSDVVHPAAGTALAEAVREGVTVYER
jgi:predicted nucleotidyltransferase